MYIVIFCIACLLGVVSYLKLSSEWCQSSKTENEFDKRYKIQNIGLIAVSLLLLCLGIFIFSPESPLRPDVAHSEGCLCEVCNPHDEHCSCDNCFIEYYKSVHHGRTCTCDDCTRYDELRGR